MTTKEGQLNEVNYVRFKVVDSNGDPVTGLTSTNFTRYLYDPTRTNVTSTTTDGINEVGTGLYEYYFTPTSEGIWTPYITHTTYIPTGVSGDIEIHQDRVWLQRTLGLVQENFYLDNTVFSGSNMTSGRLRIYSDAASVSTTSNVIGTYTITATYDANNALDTYKIVKS